MYSYLISVIVAAIICSLVVNFFEKKSTYSSVIRLLSGIFLSITVISPLVRIKVPSIDAYRNTIETESQIIIEEGIDFYQTERRNIITEQIEAYISDKASELETDLSVSVILSDSEPPVPEAVEIHGDISPYTKTVLENIIEDDLGIPKEHQLWK